MCYNKAKQQGIKTGKLPIGEYIRMASRQVLTTNQVVEIMLSWLETRDWEKAFLKTIPRRKMAVLKKGGKKGEGEGEDGGEEDEGEEDGEEGGYVEEIEEGAEEEQVEAKVEKAEVKEAQQEGEAEEKPAAEDAEMKDVPAPTAAAGEK